LGFWIPGGAGFARPGREIKENLPILDFGLAILDGRFAVGACFPRPWTSGQTKDHSFWIGDFGFWISILGEQCPGV
jgi:hypothetical protein